MYKLVINKMKIKKNIFSLHRDASTISSIEIKYFYGPATQYKIKAFIF